MMVEDSARLALLILGNVDASMVLWDREVPGQIAAPSFVGTQAEEQSPE